MVVQTVASLRKSCKKMGIKGYSGLKKAQLVRKCGSPKKKSQKKGSAKKGSAKKGSVKKGSAKKRSAKKGSAKKHPSLPQFTPPPMPKSATLPQFTSPAIPKKLRHKKKSTPKADLGSKVPWVFPDPNTKSDVDSPPSYESLYGGKALAFGFRGVQRRCSNKRVSKCHRKSRICSKNTSRLSCRLSATKRRSRARASSRRKHH